MYTLIRRRSARVAALLIAALFMIMAMTACTDGTPSTVANDNSMSNNANSSLLNEAMTETGFGPLGQSQELINILKRVQLQNDPNHISYVYLFLNGIPYPIKHFVIQGKCTSTDSQAVNPTQPLYNTNSSGSDPTTTVDAAQLDGSFGTNEPGIFCFLNNPAKTMITWSGEYFQSDTPIDFPNTPIRIETASTTGKP